MTEDLFSCTKCKGLQPLSEYHKRSRVPCGHDSWCKTCKALYRKDYFLRNKEKESARAREKAWKDVGISLSKREYDTKILALGGKCEICGTDQQTLQVDHNHTTSKIRGYLCGHCNRGLGHFKDSLSLLQKAALYLEKND